MREKLGLSLPLAFHRSNFTALDLTGFVTWLSATLITTDIPDGWQNEAKEQRYDQWLMGWRRYKVPG